MPIVTKEVEFKCSRIEKGAEVKKDIGKTELQIERGVTVEKGYLDLEIKFVEDIIHQINGIDAGLRETIASKQVFAIGEKIQEAKNKLKDLFESIKEGEHKQNFVETQKKIKEKLEKLIDEQIKTFSELETKLDTELQGPHKNFLEQLKGAATERDRKLKALNDRLKMLNHTISDKQMEKRISQIDSEFKGKKLEDTLKEGEKRVQKFGGDLKNVKDGLVLIKNQLQEIKEFSIKIEMRIQEFQRLLRM